MTKLNPKQELFVREYLVDLNATQAATRAGYSPKTASRIGPELLGKTWVAAAIQQAMAARSQRIEITADRVLEELASIAFGDPRELIEWRRTCCRHCYGVGHRYQETRGEHDRRHADWERGRLAVAGTDKEAAYGAWDDLGGVGYVATLAPLSACPECFGEGIGDAHIKDTRSLSPDARRLYAGVKVTRDGVEVKLHDKVAALTLVGRHLNMFTDKVDHAVKVTGELHVVDRPPRETREEWEARRAKEVKG